MLMKLTQSTPMKLSIVKKVILALSCFCYTYSMELSNQQISHQLVHSIIIRPYTAKDYHSVLLLAQRNYLLLYDSPQAATQAFILDMVAYDPDIHVLVLEADQSLQGFVIYTLHRYAGARINYLVVNAACRNKGYATRLLAQVCNHAYQHDYESIQVTVLQTNSSAINWYIKRGFVSIDNNFSDETELIYLEKNLKA